MSTRVRSYSKINLGLAIGPVRSDGFHGLTTLYQTLDLHDLVTVKARRASATRISLMTNHPFVPRDGRNTAWRMVERALARLGITAEVEINIEKRLPVQGGMGAGSANAAAALLGLERELGEALPGVERLKLAAEIGSDVPLFLLGGAVLGLGRGEQVVPMPDLPKTWCVVAVPSVGVSTPAAFREWDARRAAEAAEAREKPLSRLGELHPHTADDRPDNQAAEGELGEGHGVTRAVELTSRPQVDKLQELSLAYSSLSAPTGVSLAGRTDDSRPGTSGIVRDPSPEKKRDLPGENQADAMNDLAENTLLALVRTGIGSDGLQNDFEEVVFPQYPSLRITKRQLMGSDLGSSDVNRPAIYAALSGSGSALFGLYRSERDAKAAQLRVQSAAASAEAGIAVQVFLTETLPRSEYWNRMFAE
ncbi:4-(cytidine 5'-diphospho)-2-C-methyl-D-erythritol kinase [Tunturiibacter gelidoferens]|uniref:4-diphosphocytidyl-2-C-methyl-D-erythritol kinase n=1 Tax=Tunturiibacter gelidiferens TaxID=3069689 RepID=A0ACC5P0W4_9BACT|nr:4-(cytidine 5'-diphospho)-2-C-methyl-D-erythritol kinase [Edaphobacter lichenicola]MBB5340454.1 4-diphosphocytidyl-2-C-methyl-D-erythritol kinase [Edaphobacter lichenicola]